MTGQGKIVHALAFGALALAVAAPAPAKTLRCAPDAVKVGTTCVDKFEASVWSIPGLPFMPAAEGQDVSRQTFANRALARRCM